MATKTCGKCGSDIPLPGPCQVCNDQPFGVRSRLTADLSRMDLAELGRHVVTLPGWRWMAGMRCHESHGGDLDEVRGTYLGLGTQPGDHCVQWDDYAPRGAGTDWGSPQNYRPGWERNIVPDLADPATIGCLLALVREAWGDPGAWLQPVEMAAPFTWSPSTRPAWAVLLGTGGRIAGTGPTEAHALVAALEAAP